ncbi:hypothetical protein GQ457_17G010840 [Hibiscus cannabinus]
MRLLSWNIRGLGSMIKKRATQRLLQQYRCEMVVLLETKLEVVTDRMVKRVWFTDNYDFVFAPAVGKAGGILIVWDSTRFQVSSKKVENRFAVVEGTWLQEDWLCGVIGVYAPCVFEEQIHLWDDLGGVLDLSQQPWCVCGDFNMVLKLEERRACSTIPRGNRCSRIDRVLVTSAWCEHFDQLRVRSLPRGLSDHTPLLLQNNVNNGGLRPFRFINAWMVEAKNVKLMGAEWVRLKENDAENSLIQRLKRFKVFLRDWNLSSFGDVDCNITKVTKQIEDLDKDCRAAGNQKRWPKRGNCFKALCPLSGSGYSVSWGLYLLTTQHTKLKKNQHAEQGSNFNVPFSTEHWKWKSRTNENRPKHLAQDLKETEDRYDILQGELEKSLAMNGVLRTSLQQCRDESNTFQSENTALTEQVKELNASLRKCEIHVRASEEFAINKAVELTSKLQKAKQEIQKRDEDMKIALTQAREVALQVADLADAAMPLSQNFNPALDNEGKLTRLLDEIKKLGSKAHRYL